MMNAVFDFTSPTGVASAGGGAREFRVDISGQMSGFSNGRWITLNVYYGRNGTSIGGDVYGGFPLKVGNWTPTLCVAPYKMKLKRIRFYTKGIQLNDASINMDLILIKAKMLPDLSEENTATVHSSTFSLTPYQDLLDLDIVVTEEVVIEEGESVAFAIKKQDNDVNPSFNGLEGMFFFEEITE